MTSLITRDELRAALDSVTVVDALPPAPYGQRHLPGALNVVEEDSDEHVSSVLPGQGGRDRRLLDRRQLHPRPRADLPARGARLQRRTHVSRGIEDWIDAGLPVERPNGVTLDLADLAVNATAWLFEGHRRAGVDISMFVVRTPPGRAVELHVHPYAETFLLLEGRGRWTRGDDVVELEPEQMIVVPPDTPHGFRNIGDRPLLVVSVHERGTLRQTFLGREPA
jgi:mannose-6-phosphate isomerase-like protein (cupin superfamily)